MGLILKQSTAIDLLVGPFVDEDDGKTLEVALVITQAEVRLSKNGGNMAQKNEATALAHDELGMYICKLDGTDTNTLGRLQVIIWEDGALIVYHEFMVVTANVWDTQCGADLFQTDLTQMGGVAQSATDLKDFADDGYNPGTDKVTGVLLCDQTTLVDGVTLCDRTTLVDGVTLCDRTTLVDGVTLCDQTTLCDRTTLVDGVTLCDRTTLVDGVTLCDRTTLVDGVTLCDQTTLVDGVTLCDQTTLVDLVTLATDVTNDVGITQAGADKAWGTAVRTLTDLTGFSLSPAGIDAIIDEVIEGALTLRQAIRLLTSMNAGKSSGGGTATLTYRDYGDARDRIVFTVDAVGNRTGVVKDLA